MHAMLFTFEQNVFQDWYVLCDNAVIETSHETSYMNLMISSSVQVTKMQSFYGNWFEKTYFLVVTKSLFDVIEVIVNVYLDMQVASHDPFQLNTGSSMTTTMIPTMIALCA